MRKSIFLLFLFHSFSASIYSQPVKHTTSIQQIWIAYFNQSRFSAKWGSWTDLHLRTKEDFVNNFSQAIIRLGLTYYLNDNTRLTAGFAYVNHFPGDNHQNISQPELRPWQQLQWNTRYPKLRTMQWVRLEERYRRKIESNDELAEGYDFNYRLRYNFLLNVPLSKKGIYPGSWSFILNDEVHVNFGKQIVYNYFDQNRFFVGFAFQTNATDNLQMGYMNQFQQLAAGNEYKSVHVVRVFYFHNMDFRKSAN